MKRPLAFENHLTRSIYAGHRRNVSPTAWERG